MNIYLDIDGTLLHEDQWDLKNQAALGLVDFIVALRPHNTFWLTTHCRDGNPERARTIMKQYVPKELYADIDRIKPTVWDIMKTEAIDWTQDFIWFDNEILPFEWEQIEQGSEKQQAIEINLRANPNQLKEVTRDVLSTLV